MKRRVMKFGLAALLTLLLAGAMAVDAQAAEIVDSGTCGDNLTWTLDNEGLLTISGTGEMYSYNFDNSSPWGKRVGSVYIGSVYIEEGVTSIGNCAFSVCTGLTEVTIPSSVTSIGDFAFSGCTGLTEVTIPSSVTSIGDYAFSGCTGLTEMTIPSSVTRIGENAFFRCTGLTEVTVCGNCGSVGSVLDGEYVVGGPFYSCTSLTKVTFTDTVTSIDKIAAGCTGLTEVTIPSSVTKIGAAAFSGCTGLTEVKVCGNWNSFDYFDYFNYGAPFNGCTSLTKVTFTDTVTSIGDYAFSGCTGLTEVTIPSSLTSIGDYAFSGCTGLTSVTIPEESHYLGDKAFQGCSGLTHVKLPGSVIISDYVDNEYKEEILDTFIGTSVFEGCSALTSVELPQNVTRIGNSAFSGCTGLTSITVPESVTSIDESAFSGCTALSKAEFVPGAERREITTSPNAFQGTALTDIGDELTFYYIVDEYGFKKKTDEASLEAARLQANTGTLYICVPGVTETNAIKSAIRSGNQVIVSAVSDVPDAAVFCAVYDDAGKMITVRSQPITEGRDNTFIFADDSFAYASVFLMDSHGKPLCEKKDA